MSACWIIGSRARGTNRVDSDLDVTAALTDEGEDARYETDNLDSAWQADIQALVTLKVDYHSYLDPCLTPILATALREARILVFKRDESDHEFDADARSGA